MNKILKYMFLAGMAFVAISCEKEPLSEGVEGAVRFDITLSAETRAVNQSDFTPEAIKVRIYREDGALIRRYTSFEEIPDLLYLVAGNYSVKVEGGNPENRAFKEPATALERKEKLCYLGEKPFTVTAHAESSIEVNCPTINVKSNVVFNPEDTELDESGRQKYENRLLSDVSISVAALKTDATTVADFEKAVAEAQAPVLTFDASGTGYFLMPEDVTTLVWSFEATHATDGAVAQVGKISNVTAGKGYTVNFHYSRTPDGFGGISVLVDDTVEEVEDDFNFKPQPEISGSNLNIDGENIYLAGSTQSLVCESINALQTLSLGGVAFFENGAVVEGAIAGLTATKVSDTKVSFTLDANYFDSLQGAAHSLLFTMTDTEGTYDQTLLFKKTGLLRERFTFDLWANTGHFEAFVSDTASSIEIRFRKQGASSWRTLIASAAGENTYTAISEAAWSEAKTNVKGHTYYTPIVDQSIFANNNYDVELVIDGVTKDRCTVSTSTTQTIPDAGFENSGLTCFSTSSAGATFWGSGNNSITKTLCTQASYEGTEGSYCAKLQANDPGVLNMMAAGNLFTGQFNMSGMSGTVSFGVRYNWQARPSAIRLKYWANIGNATHTTYGSNIAKGAQDEASIQVVIIDWASQHKVTSGSGAPTGVWSPENGADAVSAGKVIGYGVIYPNAPATTTSLSEIEIPIYFYDKVTKPSKNYTLIISAATSRYGDDMNGCASNTMYLDDFSWVY